jgi:hypothetical protein
MLVMMPYKFRQGEVESSRGFEIKAGWTSASHDGGFKLNESLECVPVVELGDGVAITKRAYDWVDSVS